MCACDARCCIVVLVQREGREKGGFSTRALIHLELDSHTSEACTCARRHARRHSLLPPVESSERSQALCVFFLSPNCTTARPGTRRLIGSEGGGPARGPAQGLFNVCSRKKPQNESVILHKHCSRHSFSFLGNDRSGSLRAAKRAGGNENKEEKKKRQKMANVHADPSPAAWSTCLCSPACVRVMW